MFLRSDRPGWPRLGLAVLAWATLASLTTQADPPKPDAKPVGSLDTKDWLKSPTSPLQPGEIDRLIGAHLHKAGVQPAAVIGDERFVRRAYLDLTGHLPMPADLREFLQDRRPDKRARL